MSEAALTEPDALSVTLPPIQDELPCDDGVPMETERHKLQMDLLIETTWLRWATLDGKLLSTPQEMAKAEAQRAKMEKQRAEIEARRAAEAEVEVVRLRALLTSQGDASTNQ